MKRVSAVLLALTALGTAAPGTAAALAAPAGTPSGQVLTIVPGAGVTLSVDGRPYAGDVVVAADPQGGVDVVNRVGFEQYVEGIGEMPSNWPPAALQAQAVAARTYALWTVLTHQSDAAGGRICASDACQVYVGLAKTEGPYGANWAAAVRATAGQVLQYRGQVIEALYGSSDGGRTLYGGVPWLPAVDDPEDQVAPEHSWSWSAPLNAFATTLGVPDGQTLVSLVSSATQITETLQSSAGGRSTRALSPDDFHSLVNQKMGAPAGMDLPLPSYRYSVSTYGQDVRIAGQGDGNGLGMSQYGALGKAEAGWDASHILGDYYANTTLGPLPSGEMPSTIGVRLRSGASSPEIAANGPATVEDPSGAAVSTTTGPRGWVASAGSGGVSLTPSSAVSFPTGVSGGADVAPIPMRVAPPAGARTAAEPGAAPKSTTTTAPAATSTAPAGAATTPPADLPEGQGRMAAGIPTSSNGASLVGPGLAAAVILAGTIGYGVNSRKILAPGRLKPRRSTSKRRPFRNTLQK